MAGEDGGSQTNVVRSWAQACQLWMVERPCRRNEHRCRARLCLQSRDVPASTAVTFGRSALSSGKEHTAKV